MSKPNWVIKMLDRLEPDLREDFEERAAIMQYDGKLSRITLNVWHCWI